MGTPLDGTDDPVSVSVDDTTLTDSKNAPVSGLDAVDESVTLKVTVTAAEGYYFTSDVEVNDGGWSAIEGENGSITNAEYKGEVKNINTSNAANGTITFDLVITMTQVKSDT